MGYKNISIAMTTDEQTFLETFIDAITSNSENRIVCTNIENLSLSATSGTAAFTFMIDNWYILHFQRGQTNSSNVNYFNIYDLNNSLLLSLYFNNSNQIDRSTNTFRTWNFKLAINNQILMLNLYPLIGDSNNTSRASASFIFVDRDDYYGTSFITESNMTNTVTNAINGQFFFTNRSTNQTFRSYSYDRLRYVYDAEDSQAIEIIKSKSFRLPNPINGIAIPRSITLNSIFDCSYCIPDTILTVDNKKYYVLSNYSLMQIDGPVTESLTQGNITSLDRNLQPMTIADNSIVQTRLQTTTSNMEIVQNPISDR